MLASELIANGAERLSAILSDMRAWMQEHEYESIVQMQGSMSQQNSADPSAFERAQYIRALRSYHPSPAAAAKRPGPRW
jgi:dihydroorotate dehydrogenase (fumarate)